MRRIRAGLLLALFAASWPALAQTAEGLVKEGVALHDEGNFDGAIAKYRAALTLDPNDAQAWYEMAFSMSAKKDCKGAIEATAAGLKIESRYRGPLYMLHGSCQDILGDPNGALETYRNALAEQPKLFLVHFNVGVTLAKLERWPEARRAFQRAVVLKPDHASSQQALAQVYEKEGYFVPALLAHSRFLSLEPATPRSGTSLEAIDRLVKAGFEVTGKKNVSITVDPDAKADEGDFAPAALAVAMAQAGSHIDEQQSKKREPEISIDRMAGLTALLAELTPNSGGFAAEYYGPFLAALHQRGLDKVFAYRAYQSVGPEVRQWLGKHEKEVKKLEAFLAGYKAPVVTVPQEPKPAEAKAAAP